MQCDFASAAMSLPTTPERSLCFKNGKLRLTPEESHERQLACKAKRRDNNREYFRLQRAALNTRPESLARRLERLRKKREAFIAAGGVIRPRGHPRKVRPKEEESAEQNKISD